MEDFVPTRVSKLKEDATKGFVFINYEKPKRKKKDNVTKNEEENEVQSSKVNLRNNKQEDDIDQRKKQEREMKRIRYEVMKFGMSGFEKEKAEEAKVALAISLGAKVPKRKGINYKELKEQRKNTKKNITHASGLEKSLIKHKTRKVRKKDSNDILGIYGKVQKKLDKTNK